MTKYCCMHWKVCRITDHIFFSDASYIIVSPKVRSVDEGNSLILTCVASGKPKPSMTWTKVGSSDVLSTDSQLPIVNVSRPGTPDNMIQYQCTASNGVGTPVTATATITVRCKYSRQYI